MTQLEYDTEMHRLEELQEAEMRPIRERMRTIERIKAGYNCTLDVIRKSCRDLGSEYLGLCEDIRQIKEAYKVRKHELYRQIKHESKTKEIHAND